MLLRYLILSLVVFWTHCAIAHDLENLTILSYHEVANKKDSLVPEYAVTPTNFVRQIDWLRNNGYHFISVDQYLAARKGEATLPPKAILLTFDDGYQSVYQYAFPVLKMFNIPAVIALVGNWLEQKDTIDFDGKKVPRSDILSWDELKEMQQSGLIEIASHSHSLHQGILANPQGNKEPAATTRSYDSQQQKYEDESHYQQRIRADLKQNNELLRKHFGYSPRIIVWPYGRYNSTTKDIALKLGMPIGLTLDDGANTASTPLYRLRRVLVENVMSLTELHQEINYRNADLTDNDRPAKIMHVDLDNIYDPDPAQQEKNLGMLLDRIVAMGVNTVYLQAFADPDGNGSADALYFPNRHLPMRADLFNRVAWQVATRTRVKRVYAWMPLLAFDLPANEPAAQDVVVTQGKDDGHLNMGYHRLSLFSPRTQQVIKDIYADLAKSSTFDGLLFHDDVTFSDYEDASTWAMKTYKQWGLPTDLNQIRQDDDLLGRWTILKINALDNFAMSVANIVRQEQPDLRTARNLYARVVLNPRSEVWYAQSLDNSLANYDFTAIMAMPYMENESDIEGFYKTLVDVVKSKPNGIKKTIFELQATDWRDNHLIPSEELASTIKSLYDLGAIHVGYYPDSIQQQHPNPSTLKAVFSTKANIPIMNP